ncbi:hypothetical protein DFJ74DRAFT_22603 [Hyaloraphidium curvatum]|nr:hypothetical protein DFJ74DRAFT_22603 [Hyaloraphidium curvatum]
MQMDAEDGDGIVEVAPTRPAASLPIEVLLNCFGRLGKRDVFAIATVNRHWSSAAVLMLWAEVDLSSVSTTKAGIRLSLLDRVGKPLSGPSSPQKTESSPTTDAPASLPPDPSGGLDYGSIVKVLTARSCDVGSLKGIFAKCRAITRLDLARSTFRSLPKSFDDVSASPFACFAATLRALDVSQCVLPGGREHAILGLLALHAGTLESLKMHYTSLRTSDIVDFFCGPQGGESDESEAETPSSGPPHFRSLNELFIGAHRARFTPEQGLRLAERLTPRLKSLGLFGQDRALLKDFLPRCADLETLTLGATEFRPLGRFAEAAQGIIGLMTQAFRAELPCSDGSGEGKADNVPAELVPEPPVVPPIKRLFLFGGYWTLPLLEAMADRLRGSLRHLAVSNFTSVFRERAGSYFCRNSLDGVSAMAAYLNRLEILDVHVPKDLLPSGVQGLVAIAAGAGAKLSTARFRSAIEDGSDGFGELDEGIAGLQPEALEPIAATLETLELPALFFDGPPAFLAAVKPLARLRELSLRDVNKDTYDSILAVFEDGAEEARRFRGDAVFARKQVLNRFGAIAKERTVAIRSRGAIEQLLLELSATDDE